jgi:hypothetical protein
MKPPTQATNSMIAKSKVISDDLSDFLTMQTNPYTGLRMHFLRSRASKSYPDRETPSGHGLHNTPNHLSSLFCLLCGQQGQFDLEGSGKIERQSTCAVHSAQLRKPRRRAVAFKRRRS